MGKNELVWLGSPLDANARNAEISEVKRRFALEQLQLLSKLENHTADRAQSVEGPLQWVAQIPPMVAPLHGRAVRVLRKSKGFREELAKNRRARTKNLGIVFKIAACSPPGNFSSV